MRTNLASVIGITLLSACSATTDGELGPGERHEETGPDGPAVRIDVDVSGDTVTARVVGVDLGSVFGYAGHLRWDAAEATFTPAQPASSPFAQAGAESSRFVMATQAPGDLAFGATRTSVEVGEVDLPDTVTLAEVTGPLGSGAPRLWLERVVVRRADGSFVRVAIPSSQPSEQEQP